MNTLKKSFLALLSCCTVALSLYSQSSSSSIFLSAQPVPDRTVSFNVLDSGVYKPIIWGLDLAWLSETNIRRGIAFMGADRVDIVRSSFRPTNPLLNDSVLQGDALTGTNDRLNIIKTYLGANTKVILNSDHPSVDSYFSGNAARWADKGKAAHKAGAGQLGYARCVVGNGRNVVGAANHATGQRNTPGAPFIEGETFTHGHGRAANHEGQRKTYRTKNLHQFLH